MMDRMAFIPFLVEFTAQFFHTFWHLMANFPTANIPSHTAINLTSNESFTEVFREEVPAATYFQSVFLPAIQAGISVWMQVTWSWKLGAAHFNPAVSMGFVVAGVLKPLTFVVYVIIQCFSSVLAAYAVKAIVGGDPGYAAVPEDVSGVAIACNEVFVTGCLMFFILCVALDKKYDNATGPMAIGFTVFQGVLSLKAVGVVCISPSAAFGPAVVVGGKAWNRHWLLWVSDLIGGALAAAYYMTFFANDDICWLEKLRGNSNARAPLHKTDSIKSNGEEILEETEMLPRTTL